MEMTTLVVRPDIETPPPMCAEEVTADCNSIKSFFSLSADEDDDDDRPSEAGGDEMRGSHRCDKFSDRNPAGRNTGVSYMFKRGQSWGGRGSAAKASSSLARASGSVARAFGQTTRRSLKLINGLRHARRLTLRQTSSLPREEGGGCGVRWGESAVGGEGGGDGGEGTEGCDMTKCDRSQKKPLVNEHGHVDITSDEIEYHPSDSCSAKDVTSSLMPRVEHVDDSRMTRSQSQPHADFKDAVEEVLPLTLPCECKPVLEGVRPATYSRLAAPFMRRFHRHPRNQNNEASHNHG